MLASKLHGTRQCLYVARFAFSTGTSQISYEKDKDFYKCLGIQDPSKCDQVAIKKAFYKLAQ